MTFLYRRIVPVCVLLLLLAPLPVTAAEKFVAVVITGELPRYQKAHEAFVKILRAGGLSEDKVQIYIQTPNPDPMSWANSIRKAVGVGADLIVTYGAPATLAAKKEARKIPVLFADVYDPVGLGIVKDLNVPGGNITGVSSKTPLETLLNASLEIKPYKSLGVLYSSLDEGAELQTKELERVGKLLGFSVAKQDVKRVDQIDTALKAMQGKADAVFLTECALLHLKLEEIVATCKTAGLPIITQIPDMAEMGALVTLESDPIEQGQLVGVHALQVLGGQKAFTLPVRTPKKVSLVINLKAAKEMNYTVPFQALSMATKVIK